MIIMQTKHYFRLDVNPLSPRFSLFGDNSFLVSCLTREGACSRFVHATELCLLIMCFSDAFAFNQPNVYNRFLIAIEEVSTAKQIIIVLSPRPKRGDG